MIVRVLDVIGEFIGFAVQPDITDHAMSGGVGPGGKRCVADDGLGIGMTKVGIGVPDALLLEIAETAFTHVLHEALG